MLNVDDTVTNIYKLEMVDEEDLDLEQILNEQNISPMNEDEKRLVEEIQNDLINSSKQYQIPSISISNNSIQENFANINNFNRQQQSELTNDDNYLSTNSDFSDMNVDDTCKKPEQISSNVYGEHLNNMNEMHDNTTQHDQISQSLITHNRNASEQQMNAFEYCCQFLTKLNLAVNTLKSTLVNLSIPAQTGDYYLQNLRIPSSNEINLTVQDPLNKLSNLIQTGIDLLPSFRQIYNKDNVHHADPIGEELNETSERTTSVPSEHNGSHLNQDIQAPIRTNLSTSIIRKTTDSTVLSLSLSKLLSQTKTIIYDLTLTELKIFEQPRQLWRKRSINCLTKKWCSAIQGRSGKQRHCIGIEWSKLTVCHQDNLYVLVQVLTHDNQPHSSNILVPTKTKVKQTKLSKKGKNKTKIRSTLKDLIINKDCGFDANTRTILCPINEREYHQCKKNLQVLMFSLYETSEEIFTKENEENLSTEDEDEENIDSISIEDELRKLCKLRIVLCRRTEKEELIHISNFIDTELIEQSKSSEPLKIDQITPTCLCKCGNEIITVTFNTNSENNGFIVHLNDIPLNSNQIRGVIKKQISFNSIPRTLLGQKALKINISKQSILKTIKENCNPYNGLSEINFPEININYVELSDNPHEHKDTSSTELELVIQPNEIGQTESLLY